jgi:hypothetical protein
VRIIVITVAAACALAFTTRSASAQEKIMSESSMMKWHTWRPYDSSKVDRKETRKRRKITSPRKSDSLTQTVAVDTSSSRFLSIDPHFEKYPAWSPYNYAASNPINNIDSDGKDVIILNDKHAVEGMGHNGMVIGNDKTGWIYYSKDGPDRATGKQVYTKNDKYKTLAGFLESSDAAKYQHGARIKTTAKQDLAAQSFADKDLETEFSGVSNNCADLVQNTLGSIGIKLGGDQAFGVTVPNSQFATAVYSGIATDVIHINHQQQDDPPSTLLAPNPYNRTMIYQLYNQQKR